jgi:hypothetical protein
MSEYPRIFQCVVFDFPSCIYAALTPAGSDLKVEKAIMRKLRIQVLDCRSGQPLQDVPVEEVLIAAQGETWDPAKHRAVRFLGAPGWDIVESYIYPVYESGAPAGLPIDKTGLNAADWRELQRAMNALNYNCGVPSRQFGNQGWAAMEKYQMDWYDSHGQPRPPAFEKKIANDWLKRILADYNKRFIETVQMYLTGLGYPCEQDKGEWKDPSTEALARWQKVELGFKDPYTTFNKTPRGGGRRDLARKLKDARKKFFTDDEGVLHVPVPIERLQRGFQIKVTFTDFTLVPEERAFRGGPVLGPTSFSIEWVDTQQTAWQGTKRTSAGGCVRPETLASRRNCLSSGARWS